MTTTARCSIFVCALTSVGLVWVSTRGETSTNPNSRFATMESLVHRGTFVIDGSSLTTIDRVMVAGGSVSSKPPLLSVVGAGVYALLHAITGWTFRTHPQPVIMWLTLVLVGIPHVVLLLYFYRFLLVWVRDSQAAVWGFACLALGSLVSGYAVSLNNHTPAATALLVGCYYGFLLRRGFAGGARAWWLAGGLAGLAPTLDLGAAWFSLALGLYLLSHDWRRTLTLFAGAAAVPILAHFGLTYLALGSLLPAYLQPELYDYPGSWWRNPRDFDALNEPKAIYLFHLLLGHHGLFSMTPVLPLAVVALLRCLRSRDPEIPEALLVGLPLLVLLALLTATTHNYGGTCKGLRWAIVAMPLMMLFVARWLDTGRSKSRLPMVAFPLLFALGAYNAVDALQGPWAHSEWSKRLEAVGIRSVPPR